MRVPERARALAKASLFQGLAEATLLEIARTASARLLTTGSSVPLHVRGDAPMFLIVSGCAHLSLVSAGGRELILSVAGRGEVLGEIGGPNATATRTAASRLLLIAREPTQVLHIPWRSLHEAGASTELTRRCNVLLAERAAWMLELIEDLALRPLEARLARLLRRLHDRSELHPVARLHRLDQGTLALMTNATRPKVNQHLQRFKQLGAIELEQGSVRVRDAVLLASIGERE